jgi:hypothetical protein
VAVALAAEDGRLVVRPPPDGSASAHYLLSLERGAESLHVLAMPVAFFIPEHVADPSVRPAGETLWVEVTVPKRGPPRPIRLGVRKAGGAIEPLDLR